MDIETEGFDLASDEETGHDVEICALEVQLLETEEGAWSVFMARRMSLGTVAVENFRPPSEPEIRHGMEEVLNPVSMTGFSSFQPC